VKDHKAKQTTTGASGVKTNRIDQFFLVMNAIYPYRWSGAFADVDAIRVAKNEWCKALSEIADERIKRGLDVCRNSGGSFPPSIPEFVKMCQPTPEELGVLHDDRAFQNFINKDFENPIVKKTVQLLDYFSVYRMSTKDARREFLRIYRMCVEDHVKDRSALTLSHNTQAAIGH
jgi:hypothetical protein